MRWFWFVFYRVLPVAVVVALATGLARLMPLLAAWASTTAIGAAFAGTGALLLRSAQVGTVTWRNRVAGFLLPWGYVLGRGKLPGIVLACTAIWSALAAAVLLSLAEPAPVAPTVPAPAAPVANASSVPWLLLAWIVTGVCLCYLLGLLTKHFEPRSQATRTVLKLVLVLVLMIAGSVVLHLTGNSGLALLVAGGPPLLIGGGYGLFLVFILLMGRNARWN
ncbi:MAG: hypothetical protein JNL12_19670 [Planctomycetes bacterium]|nr:hypothetical protein [Planctomycetota bacterium]